MSKEKGSLKTGKVYTVMKANVHLSIDKINLLLKEAESVTEESDTWEIKAAFSKYYKVLGMISIMVILGLLLPQESNSISLRQRLLGDKLTRLSEKRTLDTANI